MTKKMKHIKLFEAYTAKSPTTHFILDGASSAGKSSALKGLDSSWAILPVDSFYNVMAEELGIEDFGNSGKPTISTIYPNCPHQHDTPGNTSYEKAARWYMAQEAQEGKIFQTGLKDDFEQALIDLRHVVAASRLRSGPIMARNPALLRRLGV
jgi:hypothetical protein